MAITSIIFINIILSGDNAVVIAMAVNSLPKSRRLQGIMFGTGAAVIFRIILTFFAAQLLMFQFVKFLGGALIIWIAVKMLIEGSPCEEDERQCKNMWNAISVILIADITMSLDNILAVAGASKGNFFLLVFGLCLSIPIVIFASNLLSKLMDRYPIILYIGAAILGRVGGDMMSTDPFIEANFHPSNLVCYSVQAFFSVGVIITARLLMKMSKDLGKKADAALSSERPFD